MSFNMKFTRNPGVVVALLDGVMERRSIGGDADAATASSMLVVALEGLVDDEAVTPKTTAHFRNTRILFEAEFSGILVG